MKKTFAIIALLLIVATLVGACSMQGPTTAAPAEPAAEEAAPAAEAATEEAAPAEEAVPALPEKIEVIGYNAYTDTVSFSKKITDNLMANAEAAGIKILKADTNGDATTALQNVDAFLAQGADLIIDSSWTVAAVEAVAKKGQEAGIPVISIDIPVDACYFMGVNNLDAGKVTGKAAVDYAAANWDSKVDYIFIVNTEAAGEEVKKRCQGVADAVAEAGIVVPEDHIIWVDPESSEGTARAKQLTTDFLTAHPDGKNIIMTCVNDQAALGMLSAVETSNRSADCVIVSQGADDPALTNLRKAEANCWIGSTAYLPEKYGDVIFEMIAKLDAGEVLPHETYRETMFINRDNLNEYYPE